MRLLAVTAKLLALVVNVPAVNVMSPLAVSVKALPKVTVPEGAFIVKGPIVFPAVVNVPVASRFIVPVCEKVIPATRVTLPETLIKADPAIVPVNPVQLIDRAVPPPVATVTVTVPDAALKNTASADVGTDAPPAPPEVADHLVPTVESQLAVPPTQ